jgi:excinuclease UvrABC ATPase subunit
MATLDIEKILKESSKELSQDVIDTLEKNREFLSQLAVDRAKSIFEFVVQGKSEDLDMAVYQQMLSGLTDQQFLDLRKETVEAAQKWAEISTKKQKIVDDLVSKVGKMAASVIVRQIVLGNLI